MKKPTDMVPKASTFAAVDRSWGGASGRASVAVFVALIARPPARPARRRAPVTERPGRKRPSVAASASSRIRTGTRCTILVKLPVAFSAGSTLNTAPVAGARLATWPWNTSPGSTSADDRRGQAGAEAGELAFLKIGVDPETARGHERDELRPDRGVGAGSGAAIADGAVDRRPQLRVAEVEAERSHDRRSRPPKPLAPAVFCVSITSSWRMAASSAARAFRSAATALR